MPDPMTAGDAASALAAANRGDGSTEVSGIVTPSPEPAAQPAPSEPQGDAGSTGEPESFTSVDLTKPLPPDPQVALAMLEEGRRQMLADYTRKTQEIAPWRNLGNELGVDPQVAAEAVRFTQALQSDPQYALQVHGELTSYLQSQGLTKGQAEVEAATIQRQATEDPFAGLDGEGEQTGPDPRDQQLRELLDWKNQQEQQQHMQQFVNYALEQQRAIQQADPNLQDGDWERIWALAPGTEGDLTKAHQAYVSMRDQTIKDYLNQKAQQPVGAPPSAPGQQPVRFENTDQAHAAAQIALAQHLASGT